MQKKNFLLQQQKKCIEQNSFQDLEIFKIKNDNTALPSDYFKLFKNNAVNFIAFQKIVLMSTLLQNLLHQLLSLKI